MAATQGGESKRDWDDNIIYDYESDCWRAENPIQPTHYASLQQELQAGPGPMALMIESTTVRRRPPGERKQ